MSTHMVSVVLYDLTYLSFSKYYFDRFRCVLDCIFCFLNYRITNVIFIFDKISFRFWLKKYESESGGAFRRSFPTVFIPTDHRTGLSGNTAESYTLVSHLNWQWNLILIYKSLKMNDIFQYEILLVS